MSTYFFIDIIIFSITGLWGTLCYLFGQRKKDITKSNFYLAVVLIILMLFIGLRGYFTGDSARYKYAWDRTNNAFSLINAIEIAPKERGYVILMYILGRFTPNITLFFCFNAAMTVWGYFKVLRKYSPIMWMSILMLVCVGPLYISMNAMRNILACALYCFAIKYAAEKDFVRYCIFVLCIATIHFSAVIMIPLYFLLNFKWNIQKRQIGALICIIAGVAFLVFIFSNELTRIAMSVLAIYRNYNYGVEFGLSLRAVLKVILIQIFIFWNHKKINLKNPVDRCFFNASILYTVFYVFALNVAILQRFAFYFAVSHMVLVPMIINRISNSKMKVMVITGMTMFLLAYAYVANYGEEFMWYWEYGL